MKELILPETISQKIFIIRGHKVMIDRDLAELYKVKTKRLNEQIKRNKKRFPQDFMFKLTWDEVNSLRSHFATLENTDSKRGKHIKYLSYAFKLGYRGRSQLDNLTIPSGFPCSR